MSCCDGSCVLAKEIHAPETRALLFRPLSFWEKVEIEVAGDQNFTSRLSQDVTSVILVGRIPQVPSMRLDFMVKRLGPGKARVVFGDAQLPLVVHFKHWFWTPTDVCPVGG